MIQIVILLSLLSFFNVHSFQVLFAVPSDRVKGSPNSLKALGLKIRVLAFDRERGPLLLQGAAISSRERVRTATSDIRVVAPLSIYSQVAEPNAGLETLRRARLAHLCNGSRTIGRKLGGRR